MACGIVRDTMEKSGCQLNSLCIFRFRTYTVIKYLCSACMISTTINLYKNAYSGLTRRMWLLAVVMLINRCGTMVLPFMTLYCHHRGYTETQGGLAVAIYGIGSLFGAFIGGRLSDKIGFYTMQFVALFGGGIMFIVLGQMDSYLT